MSGLVSIADAHRIAWRAGHSPRRSARFGGATHEFLDDPGKIQRRVPMFCDGCQTLLNGFSPGFRDGRYNEAMIRMTPIQFLHQRCHSRDFAERNRMDPDEWLVLSVWSISTLSPQPLQQSWATPFFRQQDPQNDRRPDYQEEVIEDIPHGSDLAGC